MTSPLQFGLEREFFVGDDIRQLEDEKIFSKNWICVTRKENLPVAGSFLRVHLAGHDLVLTKTEDDEYRAFHNLCRHRGTRVIEADSGKLKNSCIRCPYHAWTYDLDGCLIGAPNMNTTEGFAREDFGLFEAGCVEWGGYLLVHLERKKQHFSEDFAAIIEMVEPWNMGDLHVGHTLNYEVDANWKLVFQNYSECYHCPTVHPRLNQMSPYKSATNDLETGAFLGGPMRLTEGYATISVDGKSIGPALPQLDDFQRNSVYYYTLFPSMFLSPHPDYVMVHRLQRISNTRTKVECDFLVQDATDSGDVMRAVEQWDEVNRQDWHVCQLTQHGINSPAYRPGPYSQLEPMLVAFDQHYRRVMA
ncbi:MAG: aromatic ring-hydroxylating dioxygenase subunit alpha [Planctomycetota bacterium]